MENHLLVINDLSVSYGGVQALWDVSVQVEEGSIVALIGANGAGKSSLLRAISGMKKPKSGGIYYSGKELSGLTPEEVVNEGISLVPEGRRLFTRLTVKENLELGAYAPRARPLMRESLERVYELFPILSERTSQIAGSMSGGEQQMLAIGRSMMSNPSILLLDEPSMGLSPLVVEQMFNLIGGLNQKGVTILLVEQNVYQALQISNYAYVLQNGRITLEGPGEQLLSDPAIQTAYLGTTE